MNSLVRNSLAFMFAIAVLAVPASFAADNPPGGETQARLADLQGRTTALPAATPDEKLKKAALVLALEQARNCLDANLAPRAATLLADVDQALPKSLGAAKNPDVPFLPPLRETMRNPYLEALYAWAEADLAKPDIPWKQCTPQFNVFTGISKSYGTRDEAEQMMRYLWLVAHPQSRYRGNPELFTRLMRRAHAYLDAWDLHGKRYGDSINDFFALGPAAYSFMAIDRLWPDLLLPSQRAQWNNVIRRIGDFWLAVYADGKDKGTYRMGKYANRDIGVANILLNAGLYLKDQRCLDAAKFLVQAQESNLYPDGGFAYIGTQNESCGYHDADTTLLARYYLVTGDNSSRDLLVRSQWYGPLSMEPDGVADYWTPPSWKHNWNGGGSTGGEVVAGLSANPYLRTLLDRGLARSGKAPVDLLGMMFYRTDIKPRPLPDNYTVYDRNLQGPRARYGSFSYAATARVPNPDEPGKATIMGAMILDEPPSGGYPLNAALMLAMPQVRTKAGTMKKPDWACLTHHDAGAVTVGRHFSALSAEYGLHTFGSSTKGVEVPWTGFQEWICIKDRLIALVEIAPNGKQSAAEVAAVFRLGVGGTRAGKVKDIRTLDDHSYEYGNLVIKVHDYNFAAYKPEAAMVRISKAVELTFRDSKAAAGEAFREFQPDKPFYCVVEIRPKSTVGELAVKREVRVGGLHGLRVQGKDTQFVLWRNRGKVPVTVNLSGDVLPGMKSSLHLSRAFGKAPCSPAPEQVAIPPGEQVLVVSSPDAALHEPGWDSFEQLAGQAFK